MKTTHKVFWIIGMLAVVTLACNSPIGQNLSEADSQATTIAETVAAEIANADQSAVPSQDQPQTQNSPQTNAQQQNSAGTVTLTFTPVPTGTNIPTAVPQSTATTQPTATSIPCNKVSFVNDITYPDDSKLFTDTVFTKTWRLKNTGSCTWTSGYKLIFSHGDRMNAPNEVMVTGGTVAPGQTVDVSVDLTAPSNEGTYQGNFKLKDPNGNIFALGDAGTTPFYVKIKTVKPAVIQPPGITPMVAVFPEASATYDAQYNCGGNYILSFRVDNTGVYPFESYAITVKDLSSGVSTALNSNTFGNNGACIAFAINSIAPGDVAYVTSAGFQYELFGSNVEAKIKLYTEKDQGGLYAEQILHFIE